MDLTRSLYEQTSYKVDVYPSKVKVISCHQYPV